MSVIKHYGRWSKEIEILKVFKWGETTSSLFILWHSKKKNVCNPAEITLRDNSQTYGLIRRFPTFRVEVWINIYKSLSAWLTYWTETNMQMQTLNQTVNRSELLILAGWIRVLVVMVCVFVCQLYTFHISAKASVFVWTFKTWRRGSLCLWRLLIILFPRILVSCCFLSTHSSPSVKCLCSVFPC